MLNAMFSLTKMDYFKYLFRLSCIILQLSRIVSFIEEPFLLSRMGRIIVVNL